MPLIAAVMVSLPWVATDQVAPAETRPSYTISHISRVVRDFLRVGDAALSGTTADLDRRSQVMRDVSEQFRREPKETWHQIGNAAELLRFVLFGGSAAVLKRAVEDDSFPKEFVNSARGIIAFSERNLELAKAHLLDTEPVLLPQYVEEPLALVRGTLLATKNSNAAISYFRRVQLAAPGTALEEAALRQNVLALIRNRQISDSITMMTVYLRRFPGTIYWRQFSGVAAAGLAAELRDEVPDLLAKTQSVSTVALQRYREFLLEISKCLLMEGQFDKAFAIADFLVRELEPTSEMWRRADLYRNLSEAAQPNSEAALGRLLVLDRARYSSQEQKLIEAGIAIASAVKGGYQVGPGAALSRAALPTPPVPNFQMSLPDDVTDRVDAAMKTAQKSIEEAQP